MVGQRIYTQYMSDHQSSNGAAGAPMPVENVEGIQEEAHEPVDPELVSKLISIRLTEGIIARLRAAAKQHSFPGYQSLMKHILRTWLDDSGVVAPAADSGEDELVPLPAPRPARSRMQLLTELREAIKRQEDARARSAGEEAQLLEEEIERIKDELADLENDGGF